MNDRDRLFEQIKRMRRKGVEPEVIYMSYELYTQMGKPRRFNGIYVDCDNRLDKGFEVR